MASLHGLSAPGPIYCRMDLGLSQVVIPVSQLLECGISSSTLLPVRLSPAALRGVEG
jgi:hypothetical protein